MLRNWCLATSQEKTATRPNNSFMGITINAVIHADDDLTKWIDRRLDMTMGRREKSPPLKGNIYLWRSCTHDLGPTASAAAESNGRHCI